MVTNTSVIMCQEAIQLLPIKTRRKYIPVGSGAALTARDGGNAIGLSGTILAPAAHGLDRQQLSTSYKLLLA